VLCGAVPKDRGEIDRKRPKTLHWDLFGKLLLDEKPRGGATCPSISATPSSSNIARSGLPAKDDGNIFKSSSWADIDALSTAVALFVFWSLFEQSMSGGIDRHGQIAPQASRASHRKSNSCQAGPPAKHGPAHPRIPGGGSAYSKPPRATDGRTATPR